MVVASPEAQFGLPEVAVGLYAAAGGLPRLMRIVGLQLASEIAMTGRRLSAREALEYRFINRIAKSTGSVVDECLELAGRISSFSPDGIIVTRQGLREAWENPSVEQATSRTRQEYMNKLVAGDNFKIGVEAFARKMRPKWVPSRL
jgi:enoyl-CoA hydratase/carnithine racemase